MDQLARLSAMHAQCDRLIGMLGPEWDDVLRQRYGPDSQCLHIWYEGDPFTIGDYDINNGVSLCVYFYQRNRFQVMNCYNVPIFDGRVTSTMTGQMTPTTITDGEDVRPIFAAKETNMRIRMEYNATEKKVSSVSFKFVATTWLTEKL